MNVMDALFTTCSYILNSLNSEVFFVTTFLTIIFYVLWKWTKNPNADFDALNLFKTNGHEDVYKLGYVLFAGLLGWALIIQVKNKTLDIYMLLTYCGFAFGPPMFNSTLRVISNIFGRNGGPSLGFSRDAGPSDDKEKKDK